MPTRLQAVIKHGPTTVRECQWRDTVVRLLWRQKAVDKFTVHFVDAQGHKQVLRGDVFLAKVKNLEL